MTLGIVDSGSFAESINKLNIVNYLKIIKRKISTICMQLPLHLVISFLLMFIQDMIEYKKIFDYKFHRLIK